MFSLPSNRRTRPSLSVLHPALHTRCVPRVCRLKTTGPFAATAHLNRKTRRPMCGFTEGSSVSGALSVISRMPGFAPLTINGPVVGYFPHRKSIVAEALVRGDTNQYLCPKSALIYGIIDPRAVKSRHYLPADAVKCRETRRHTRFWRRTAAFSVSISCSASRLFISS